MIGLRFLKNKYMKAQKVLMYIFSKILMRLEIFLLLESSLFLFLLSVRQLIHAPTSGTSFDIGIVAIVLLIALPMFVPIMYLLH